MNIRLSPNEIRFRFKKNELENLLKTEKIEETLFFSREMGFSYCVLMKRNISEMELCLYPNQFVLHIHPHQIETLLNQDLRKNSGLFQEIYRDETNVLKLKVEIDLDPHPFSRGPFQAEKPPSSE